MVAPFPPLIYSAQPPLCRCRLFASSMQLMETTICSSSSIVRVAAYCTPLERETSAWSHGGLVLMHHVHTQYYNATAVLLDNARGALFACVTSGTWYGIYTSLHFKQEKEGRRVHCNYIRKWVREWALDLSPLVRLLHLVLSCTRE